tara:strand:+ start:196 stop:441 length:246 start_codon:yes stop_codon:yes gene_type:complete
MSLKIESNLKYIGDYVAYQLCGFVKEITPVIKKYKPHKIILTGNSKETKIEEYAPDVFLTVYILLNKEQAMLFRLSNKLDK